MEENKELQSKSPDSTETTDEAVFASSQSEKKPKRKKRGIVRKIFAAIGIILLAMVITLTVMLYSSVKTIMTVEQVDEGIFKITYEKDYQLDKALEANISTDAEFLEFVSRTFCGTLRTGASPACRTSARRTPGCANSDGGRLTIPHKGHLNKRYGGSGHAETSVWLAFAAYPRHYSKSQVER